MTNLHDIINFMFAVIGITLAGLGFTMTVSSNSLDLWTKRFFAAFFLIFMGAAVSDLIITLSMSFLDADGVIFTKLGIFGGAIFQMSIVIMLSLLLFHLCNEDWLHSKSFYFSISLWLAYLIHLGIAQFTKFIYYVDSSNIYHRGALYILFLPIMLLMGINIVTFYGRRDKISQIHRTAFWIILTLPLLALIAQLFFSGIRFILIGTTISAITMFMYILKEQAAETARQQLNIKILQIRPHFIYNIMTSIYYLCERDAHKAQSVIKSFTAYLQKNFSAIVKRDLIPFDEELEHTQAYLAVEKARHEKLLFIEYDTPDKSFRLPPLTLQPIVENAVKHGVDAELEPLHISIRTAQLELANHEIIHEIIVEDTGPGFDRELIYDKDNNIKAIRAEANEAHIGLNNIIERLRMMCGGTVSIEPRDGGGTVVRIRIKNSRRRRSI